MDKDRIAGSANQAKGAIKEAVGKATGDAKLKTEGATDKMKGKLFDTAKIELSPDGKTLTITTSVPGRTKPNIQVFDRE